MTGPTEPTTEPRYVLPAAAGPDGYVTHGPLVVKPCPNCFALVDAEHHEAHVDGCS